MGRWLGVSAALFLVLTPFAPATAQTASSDPGASGNIGDGCCIESGSRVLEATYVAAGEIRVDGVADEEAWTRAAVATDFVQFEPNGGEPASERTEARVLYGNEALYVALRAFESSPNEIVGQMTRRDQESHSDLLGVLIDSYFDRRTAFHFVVNPVGVKHDIYRFDDIEEDAGWDAVWDVATRRDAEGWTAEFEIPYSQLRFRDAPNQTWGINFTRDIARRQETDVWAPTTRADAAMVSRAGELRGLRDLTPPKRMEILPYSVGQLERAPGDRANPFYKENDAFGTFGVDVKYGVTSDLTLDVTINPDFGQVEADPAQVNLTAFETFLPERRPFFLEGSSIFNFSIALGDGDGASESLFYSRRIGRSPQGAADPAGGFADAEDQTTILGAWKLSGKTSGGWSIGVMHAITAEERARIAPELGEHYQTPVEPLSSYGVVRVQRDFRDGRSAIGFIGTGTRRNSGVAEPLGLRASALVGGVDFRHRFGGEDWELTADVLGSRVAGSSDAIARTQRSAARYYHRPDAGHITYDPTRTSLSGGSVNVALSKIAGSYWRVGTGVQTRTPGFEVNDLGFMNSADYFTHWGWLGYHHSTEQGPFREWFLNLNAWHVWNYGKDRIGTGANVNLNFKLLNFWNGWLGVNQEFEAFDSRLLRGGPLIRREPQTNFWAGMGTDSRKAVQLNLNGFGNIRPESQSWTGNVSPNVRIRPSGRATFNIGTFVSRNVNDRQWVRQIDTTVPHYVMGRIDQTTVGLTARVDFAFSPDLSLQLYAQPFVSGGTYGDYKQVADPGAPTYSARFAALSTRASGDRLYVDLDGDGSEESFSRPDFNFKQFRSNAVLRWEYRPGSALFFVWSQGRDHFAENGGFDFGRDVGELFSERPQNVFMVKLSYWLSR